MNISESDRVLAFPTLSPQEIGGLERFGTDRAVSAGEILFAEGQRGFSFFVVLDGAVEIIERSSGEERQVAMHETGEFTGDVDMLTGRAAIVTGRARVPGRVLQLTPDALRDS